MGVRLIVEILDHWQDAGLTAGERADLLVLAENANDGTRETVGPVHEEYILQRAGKKATGWRASIGALKRKGVLEYATRNGREMSGFPGQHAVYRIAVLCPEAPHDGYKGMCTRPERVSSRHTQSDAAPETGGPRAHPIGGMGVPSAHERVSSQHTPTPPYPSGKNPPPSPTPPPPSDPPRSQGREGGRELSPDEQTAIDTLAAAIANEPRLTLGEAELAALLPLVQPWLARASPEQLRTALTAGLPERISSPAAFVRDRLRRKLPRARATEPAPAGGGLPAWCEECGGGNPAARLNAKFRKTPAGEKCPECHPDSLAAPKAA